MRQRVALLQTTLFGDLFVATVERNRLERKERNLLRIVESETNDRANLVVVDSINQGGNENDFNTCFVEVVDGSHLHVKQIAYLSVAVCIVTDSVKLEINVTQTSF